MNGYERSMIQRILKLKRSLGKVVRTAAGGRHYQVQLDNLLRHVRSLEGFFTGELNQVQASQNALQQQIQELQGTVKCLRDRLAAVAEGGSVALEPARILEHVSVSEKYFQRHRELFAALLPDCFAVESGATAVEFGCGIGAGAPFFTERGFKYVGLDASPLKIEFALKTRLTETASFLILSEETLEQPQHSADIVVALLSPSCWSVLETERAIGWAARILKDGGSLLFGTPYPFSDYSGTPWDIHEQLNKKGFYGAAEGGQEIEISADQKYHCVIAKRQS